MLKANKNVFNYVEISYRWLQNRPFHNGGRFINSFICMLNKLVASNHEKSP